MPLPADYHMHTPLCRHAVGEPTELAAHARRVGLTEIGFSEHNPMVRDDWDDWHMLQGSFDTYLEKVDQARRDHPSLSIKIALEMDFIPGRKLGPSNWLRAIPGIISSAPSIMCPIPGTWIIQNASRNGKRAIPFWFGELTSSA